MALVFDRDFAPRHGEAVEVAPGIRRVTAPNPGPYTFRGTNTFLVGDRSLVIVDPGPESTPHTDALLRAIGGAKVEAILVTHAHHDHSAAAARLKAHTGARILAGRRAPSAGPGDTAPIDDGADVDFVADEILEDGAIISDGPCRLEIVATPGHASDHLVFALPDRNLLFSGDHVMGWATTMVAPPDGSMAAYMDSLARLLVRPETLYLPAHGGEIRNAKTYVEALRSHRQMRERAILDALSGGEAGIPDLVSRLYPGLAPELRAAASLSTLAHLEDLAARGLVAVGGDAGPGARYRAIAVIPPPPPPAQG